MDEWNRVQDAKELAASPELREIARLRTALAETREALAPLAAFAPCFDTGRHVNADAIVWATPTDGTDKIVLRVEDARDARAILAKHAGLVP
jgi:hypothetical protein